MTRPIFHKKNRPGGFTLVELLVVVTIFLILAALSMPGITSTLAGIKITNATALAVDEIQLARATALARNTPVEVWFLKGSNNFQMVRSSLVNPDSSSEWISRTRQLPEGIAIASAEAYSNLIGIQSPTNSPSGVQGVRILIFPSGRVELPPPVSMNPNTSLFFTIVPSSSFDPNSGDALPANFATVQINPINARVTTIRP